jgi:hypothetical protein
LVFGYYHFPLSFASNEYEVDLPRWYRQQRFADDTSTDSSSSNSSVLLPPVQCPNKNGIPCLDIMYSMLPGGRKMDPKMPELPCGGYTVLVSIMDDAVTGTIVLPEHGIGTAAAVAVASQKATLHRWRLIDIMTALSSSSSTKGDDHMNVLHGAPYHPWSLSLRDRERIPFKNGRIHNIESVRDIWRYAVIAMGINPLCDHHSHVLLIPPLEPPNVVEQLSAMAFDYLSAQEVMVMPTSFVSYSLSHSIVLNMSSERVSGYAIQISPQYEAVAIAETYATEAFADWDLPLYDHNTNIKTDDSKGDHKNGSVGVVTNHYGVHVPSLDGIHSSPSFSPSTEPTSDNISGDKMNVGGFDWSLPRPEAWWQRLGVFIRTLYISSRAHYPCYSPVAARLSPWTLHIINTQHGMAPLTTEIHLKLERVSSSWTSEEKYNIAQMMHPVVPAGSLPVVDPTLRAPKITQVPTVKYPFSTSLFDIYHEYLRHECVRPGMWTTRSSYQWRGTAAVLPQRLMTNTLRNFLDVTIGRMNRTY